MKFSTQCREAADGFVNTDEVKAMLYLRVSPAFTAFYTNPGKVISTKGYLAMASVVKTGGLEATLSSGA